MTEYDIVQTVKPKTALEMIQMQKTSLRKVH